MDKLEELEKLAKLKEQWILTEDEFAREKRRVLEGRASETPKTNEAERVDHSNPEFSKLPTYHDSSKDGPFAMFLSHRGRITRSQWIARIMILYVVMIPWAVLLESVPGNLSPSERAVYGLTSIAFLFAIYGLFAVTSKRFHDFNTHGIAQVIPVYGLLAPLLKKGNGVDNRYGPPKTYSGVAEDVRPGLSPWFGWAIVAWIAAIFAVIAILGFSETESKSESGPRAGEEVMGSSKLPSEGQWGDSKSTSGKWVKYESVDYGFSAEFPSAPRENNEDTDSGRGFLTVQSGEGEYTFFISATRLDSELDVSMIDGSWIRKMTESYGTINTFSSGRAITSEWTTTIGFTASFVEGHKLEGRYIFVGRILYVVQIGYEKSTDHRHESSDRFLDSFKATK